jgi:hypothetical protein
VASETSCLKYCSSQGMDGSTSAISASVQKRLPRLLLFLLLTVVMSTAHTRQRLLETSALKHPRVCFTRGLVNRTGLTVRVYYTVTVMSKLRRCQRYGYSIVAVFGESIFFKYIQSAGKYQI